MRIGYNIRNMQGQYVAHIRCSKNATYSYYRVRKMATSVLVIRHLEYLWLAVSFYVFKYVGDIPAFIISLMHKIILIFVAILKHFYRNDTYRKNILL